MSRRLDILIENGAQFVVVIENKVYALETSGQIADYQKWLSDRLRGAAKGLLVFLTRKGSAPEGQLLDQPRIHRLSYGDVGRWLGTFTGLPPSLGATVRMYADICGELGSDAMNTQIEEDFSQILEGSSDLALALKISRWAEGQRTATFDEFWNEVQRQLDQKLHEWDLTKSWKMHRFPHSSKQIKESRGSLCIVPTSATADPLADAGWRPPCFTVMCGNTHGGQERCYYGIRAWGPISAMDQSNREYHELAETFRSLRFFVNHGWFVAYAYTTEEARELPDFQMENDDSVVRLFEDNHAANRPYATLMATKIWEVFDKAHAALERLNAAKLAQI